ncbi:MULTISPECIES: Crp/Fnr family transcriptional regulator [unclassified Candidatus Frackibacter]|uniref:Crp/Fnr family transcriptional regulator n=1 Tax=unclassified Candidatus Frackibacter TaxID=2648818 RepID=UPI00087FC3B2|nr:MULTISPECIES: Crp/Fnr family transcriptional regulator [unclassified Candidatus Frackibacter]SDC40927.1 CRP/FNR family transcriptional regulator, anaerobic regulatory protein [Candidatus Frackibacter sp. WG11]SEM59942.1 CRP/FNR family transcriptional regulator, anaerobic regulatory protein [Candidatus Frackibacter sp. WG12]SFL62135.1 CRP/FNR family transcriptional regulator, anaerobic regulatory protein [Candidatus Frackibacter sp. WG13]
MRRCVQCSVRMNSILADLTPEELVKVEELLVDQELKKGEVLFRQNEKMHGCYIVKSGRVKLYKHSSAGQGQILRVINPGEIVGLCALRKKSNYGHTAEAMEDSVVCYLNKTRLNELFAINPSLTEKFIATLTEEVSTAYERIFLLGTKTAREKVANLLISLATADDKALIDGMELSLSLSRAEMAEMLGVSMETAIRVISDFKDEGLIAGQGKHLIIKDATGLEAVTTGG